MNLFGKDNGVVSSFYLHGLEFNDVLLQQSSDFLVILLIERRKDEAMPFLKALVRN